MVPQASGKWPILVALKVASADIYATPFEGTETAPAAMAAASSVVMLPLSVVVLEDDGSAPLFLVHAATPSSNTANRDNLKCFILVIIGLIGMFPL